jgi:RimJ/RimL family protein N-acetyltransferase
VTDQSGAAIVLRPISASAAEVVAAGRPPSDVRVAPDYPTEFSVGIMRTVGGGSPLGPYFLHRSEDDVVVGEIGGGFVRPGVVEIGYAVVPSAWGRGYATAAVRALVELAGQVPGVEQIVAHTPLDRPASGRVLDNAGFRFVADFDDEHEGVRLRVQRWEVALHQERDARGDAWSQRES